MAKKSKSAKKRVKTSQKRRARNLAAKKATKDAFKLAERAVAERSAEVMEMFVKAISAIDKAVQRGIIHQNKAARKKSRLQKKINKQKKG